MKFKLGLPGIMLLVIICALICGEYLTEYYKQVLYTISLFIKSSLLFILPFIIFLLLFASLVKITKQKGGVKLILMLIPLICMSNFITTWVAYASGRVLVSGEFAVLSSEGMAGLLPLREFHFPVLIKNEVALFLGMASGAAASFIFRDKVATLALKANSLVLFLLNYVIVPVMPLFIFGFLVKLQHYKVMGTLLKEYSYLFLVVVTVQVAYMLFLYGLSQRFNIKKWFVAVKNVMPAMAAGFSTMSSASALPLIFEAADKNTKDHMLSRLVISITVNIHLIGDCIAIPIAAFALLQNFGMDFPGPMLYLIFSFYFVLAKFAVAAVPAGGILVMLPILEQYLGFSNGMLSMITAIYIVFDPIITSVNVGGNSAFVILFDVINTKLFSGEKKAAT